MSNDDKTYNGYANYETWNVCLWLSNEQGSDSLCREMVEEAGSVYRAAEAIKDFVEESNPLADDASLFSDILRAALHEVDWYEVAQAFKPDEWGDGDEPPEEDPASEYEEEYEEDKDEAYVTARFWNGETYTFSEWPEKLHEHIRGYVIENDYWFDFDTNTYPRG